MRVVLLFSGKLNEWFNANVLQGVCEVLEPEGYDVSPTFVTGRQETERYFAKLPKNRNADAIIISSFQLDESAREKLRVTDMPTVGVNIPAESFCDAAIGVDNYDGMSKAVRLLKSLGHQRIAFVVDYIPDDMVYSTSQRMEAFLEAAEQNGYDDGPCCATGGEITVIATHANRHLCRNRSSGNRSHQGTRQATIACS